MAEVRDPLPCRNLITRVPKSAGPFVATLVHSIFARPDSAAVHAQFERVADQLAERFPPAAKMLAEAGPDILAFTFCHSTALAADLVEQPPGATEQEIRRRTDVVGIFLDPPSPI